MGEMADYYAEMAWAYEDELEKHSIIEEYCVKGKWVMKDGKPIKISKMETSHIINCIKKIEKHNWRTQYLDLFNKELEKRKNN